MSVYLQSGVERERMSAKGHGDSPDQRLDLGSGKLSGKKAVITGADSGIGRAVAIAYALEGADARNISLPSPSVCSTY
jgi:hypothetical protein